MNVTFAVAMRWVAVLYSQTCKIGFYSVPSNSTSGANSYCAPCTNKPAKCLRVSLMFQSES